MGRKLLEADRTNGKNDSSQTDICWKKQRILSSIIEEILGTSQREIGEPGSGNHLAIALVLAALALVTISVAVAIGVSVFVSMECGQSDGLSVIVLILEELQGETFTSRLL